MSKPSEPSVPTVDVRRYETFEEFEKAALPRTHQQKRTAAAPKPEDRVATRVLSVMRKTLT